MARYYEEEAWEITPVLMNVTSGKAASQRGPKWLWPAIGYTLAAVSLIWVFREFRLEETLEDFARLDWRFVTVAVVFDLAVYVIHGWRWSILLNPIRPVKVWRVVQAIYIGLYANEILPLRTGEVIRCYLVSHWGKIPLSLAISAAAIERLLDGIWLALAFWITTLFLDLPVWIIYGAKVMAILVVVLMAIVIWISTRKTDAHAVAAGSRWAETLRAVVDGVHDMGRPSTLLKAFFASGLYLALQLVPIWALIHGYGLGLSVFAACTVLVIMRIGTAIPSAPGNAGLFQGVVVLALGLFGVAKSTAVGFSLMLFGVLTLPLLIGGFIAVALSGLKFGDIRSKARYAHHEPVGASPEQS